MRANGCCLSSFIGQFLPEAQNPHKAGKKPCCAYGDMRFICANMQYVVINLNDDYGLFLIFNDSFCLMDLCLTATM